jgi:hypothetical protein
LLRHADPGLDLSDGAESAATGSDGSIEDLRDVSSQPFGIYDDVNT